MEVEKSPKLIRNAVGCFLCGTVAESKTVHEWSQCKCGNIFTDGGLQYLHRGIYTTQINGLPTFIDLSQYE